ncbi:MAG: helical backbone metal receptor [Microthrixaceae bacterium]
MRIVSLVPSASETLRAWGVDPIAVTRFCEQPDLETVGGTKNPDVDKIRELRPDLVVVDREENRREDHDALIQAGLNVHVLAIRSIADLNSQMPELAERVGAAERWEPIPQEVDTRALDLRAFVPIWRRPWMALGTPTYGADLLGLLGVAVVPSGQGPYPETDLDAIRDERPDLVLAPTEPYAFSERHLPELDTVAPATIIDGKDLFWWGTRTQQAIGRLGAVIGRA